MSYKTKIKQAVYKFTTAPITRDLMTTCTKYISVLKQVYAADPKKYAAQYEQLREIEQTFATICRLHGRISAALMAEMLTILGMMVLMFINDEFYHKAGMFVWPTMLAGGFYIGFASDKMDKKKDTINQQMAALDKLKER